MVKYLFLLLLAYKASSNDIVKYCLFVAVNSATL